MANKKDKKRKENIQKKSVIETFKFQTCWGYRKQFGEPSEVLTAFIETEMNCILELGIYEDLLSIKDFVDDVKIAIGIEPIAELGDFVHSLISTALGIVKITDANKFSMPAPWQDLVKKRILSIYYPGDMRNKVVEYAKTRNYNTSTYLGQPIVKFKQLYIKIERKI